MGVNVSRGTKCSCGRKARKGQRTCKVCHAAYMKDCRDQEAKRTIYGYTTMTKFLDYRDGVSKTLEATVVPGENQTLVKIIVCKSRKKP